MSLLLLFRPLEGEAEPEPPAAVAPKRTLLGVGLVLSLLLGGGSWQTM